jgi:hypothetical protein
VAFWGDLGYLSESRLDIQPCVPKSACEERCRNEEPGDEMQSIYMMDEGRFIYGEIGAQ